MKLINQTYHLYERKEYNINILSKYYIITHHDTFLHRYYFLLLKIVDIFLESLNLYYKREKIYINIKFGHS